MRWTHPLIVLLVGLLMFRPATLSMMLMFDVVETATAFLTEAVVWGGVLSWFAPAIPGRYPSRPRAPTDLRTSIDGFTATLDSTSEIQADGAMAAFCSWAAVAIGALVWLPIGLWNIRPGDVGILMVFALFGAVGCGFVQFWFTWALRSLTLRIQMRPRGMRLQGRQFELGGEEWFLSHEMTLELSTARLVLERGDASLTVRGDQNVVHWLHDTLAAARPDAEEEGIPGALQTLLAPGGAG